VSKNSINWLWNFRSTEKWQFWSSEFRSNDPVSVKQQLIQVNKTLKRFLQTSVVYAKILVSENGWQNRSLIPSSKHVEIRFNRIIKKRSFRHPCKKRSYYFKIPKSLQSNWKTWNGSNLKKILLNSFTKCFRLLAVLSCTDFVVNFMLCKFCIF
jgi:hypothetical protein